MKWVLNGLDPVLFLLLILLLIIILYIIKHYNQWNEF